MKIVPSDSFDALSVQVGHELLALQKANEIRQVTDLIDNFHDAEGNQYIVT